jgi:predicted negative regulator of RcsB-dependent stress response
MNIHSIPHRSTSPIACAIATLALLSTFGTAQAAIFKDSQLESLQDAGQYAELEQLAQASLRANAADAEANAALSLALTFVEPSDGRRLEATMQLAQVFLTDSKDLPKAKGLYEGLLRHEPTQAAGAYGLGRVHAAIGQYDQAIRVLEWAKMKDGADHYPIDHRLGDAYLAKGDKALARDAYERFISNKRSKPANVESARSSLAKLG